MRRTSTSGRDWILALEVEMDIDVYVSCAHLDNLELTEGGRG